MSARPSRLLATLLLAAGTLAAGAAEPPGGLTPALELQPGDIPKPPRDDALLGGDSPAERLDSPCEQARDRLAKAERDLRESAPQGFAIGRQRDMNARRDRAELDVRSSCK